MEQIKYKYIKKKTKPLEIIIFILILIFQSYNIYIVFNETKRFTNFSVMQGVLKFELISTIILLILSFIFMILTAISRIRGLSSIIFLMPICKEIIGSSFYWRRGLYYVDHPEELFIPLASTILICLIIIVIFVCYMNVEKIAKRLKPITTMALFLGMADMIWVATNLNWYTHSPELQIDIPICILIGFEIALNFSAYKKIKITDDTPIKIRTSLNNNAADTVKKYKELLDNGAITQEEFEKKKKQLLNF